jgi:sec-independent protein translocase protein TatB
MFDVGFWELTLILIVALLVVGPERLPRVARSAGLWMGKMRRFVSTVRADIQRELAAEELKETLAKQAKSTGLHEIIEETREIAADAGQTLKEPADSRRRSESPDASPGGEATDSPHDAKQQSGRDA